MDNRGDDERKYDYKAGSEELHRQRAGQRKSSSRLEKRLKKKARKEKRNLVLRNIGIVCIAAAIICVIVGTGVGIGMYTAVSTEISDMNISELALNHSSYIMYTDSSGNEAELEQIKSIMNKKWVSSSDISPNLKNAAVAIEDQRFYKHHGVDIKRTFGATVKYVLSKLGVGDSSYGGSTITQQVIKNITKEADKKATRKIKEMMRAIALEKQLDKDEILTMYLNIAFFANNCYGVEAASNTYFRKSASEVSIAEAAAIVGITQLPGKFDPYVNPENTIEKRNRVLGKMLELGMISQEEHDSAVASSLKVVEKKSSSGGDVSSYFVDQVVNDVISDLQTVKGYSKEFAQQQLTNGGLRIHATIDPEIQEKIEKVFENKSNFPSGSAQAAMVIVDPYTGEIKGLVGGIGQKTDIRGFNRATQAKRQPGSAIKPLSVYAPALDLEKIDASVILKDEKITIGSDNWEPSNSYSGFKGDMIVREAVGRSSNIPAVKVLDMIGINRSYSFLENNFKLSLLQSADKNYSSLALGGLTSGVTVKEMAAAYAVFVNGGKYFKPHTYTKVTDSSGNVVLENQSSSTQAVKASTAYIMADLLRAPVNDSYGTARAAKLSGFETFGKTGTTNDNIDKWFVGFTSHYVGAVWYGYDQPKSIGASSNPSTAVWKKVMESVHSGLEDKELTKPADVVETEICTDTGYLAKRSCDSITAYFVNGKQPKKTCSGHKSKSRATAAPDETSETETASEKPKKTKTPTKPAEIDGDTVPSPGINAPAVTEAPEVPQKADTPQQTAVPEPGGGDGQTGAVGE
ncbi:MAG: PBP1A family penicillin-binding protein [Clostridia bacterium]|nr:PBP1A family penicillin-binding protein [Clostridia bacterium]